MQSSKRKRTPTQEEERREQFISIISHQLRTPLSILRGYLEALQNEDMGKLSEGQKEYLTEAGQINANMIDLVNRYMDILSQKTKDIKARPKPVALAGFLKSIAKQLAHYAKATNSEFALDLPKKEITIQTDEQLLRNALTNIIQNSIKYTLGSGTITLRLNSEGSHVHITVSDAGIGIPKDQQDQVFTKFFRGKNIIHRSIAGSGLGLYITQQYVAALKGDITFTSKEGKGTDVTIALPIK